MSNLKHSKLSLKPPFATAAGSYRCCQQRFKLDLRATSLTPFATVLDISTIVAVVANDGSRLAPCSLGLSATSQQYFSLTTNQPPATSQQYSSLRTNQHQPSATSQPNRQ
jgi:ATP adenylyltransferase/5',5'''-P-1,P-4-tetraphosphate phosphorylase II